MILKKVYCFFKRHHFLYIARFKLLSKNSNVVDIDSVCYNQINQEKDIPDNFKEVNAVVFKDKKAASDIELVKHLSIWLQNNIKGGPGLSEPSDTALQIMLAGKGGVCSDIAQVFNNFCVINSIKVREWGTTRAPFNKEHGGHSFNEIYSETYKKWILVDASSCLMFYNSEENPLSVVELYEAVRANKKIEFKTFNSESNIEEANIKRNFLNPDTIPFLICNYSNKTYDSFLRFFRPHVPVFIIHFIIYSLRKSYHYKFPLDDYRKIFS